MTDVYWVLLFAVCIITALITYFTTNLDENPLFIMSFLGALISGFVLYLYMVQPQSYSEKKLSSRIVQVFQGEGHKNVVVYDTLYLESSNYLGGLIKDSSVEWVNEDDIGSNGTQKN